MFLNLLYGLAGIALLYIGGELLVRGSVALALRLGISVLAVGLTVVSFGTSAPELVVALNAALRGANDVAVGAVVGSNIANIALILGATMLIRPCIVHGKLMRVDIPIMILASFALLLILDNGQMSKVEGIFFLLGLLGFVYVTFVHARQKPERYHPELVAVPKEPEEKSMLPILLVVAGCAALAAGGHVLVNAAVAVATMTGISQAAIGLTVVAVGTSLPEFAASLIAARRGHADMAIGNIVGSNIFNLFGILGTTAVVTPLVRGDINWVVLWIMTGLAVLLYLLLLRTKKFTRPKAALLLATYVAYIVFLAG